MENFFVSHSEIIKFNTNNYHYDGTWADGNILRNGDADFTLPFNVAIFFNMRYDYGLISDEGIFYRLNKCKLVLERIGTFDDGVLAFGYNEENIIFITENEIFLFNAYFDLCKSKVHGIDFKKNLKVSTGDACCENKNENFTNSRFCEVETEPDTTFACASEEQKCCYCKFVWADELFCLFSSGGFYMFNLSLELLRSSSLSISSATFISKYNKFASVLNGAIKFIEPNGLEHGDPLEVDCRAVDIIKVDDVELLLAIHKESVDVFYMKNFYWYKKLEISGKFFSCEGNRIILRNEQSVEIFYICKEMTTDFVIDRSTLKYTNLSVSLIPPPYYYKSIDFGSQVLAYACNDGVLSVITASKFYKYKVKDDCFYEECVIDVELQSLVNEMIFVGDVLLVRCGNVIYSVSKGEFNILFKLHGVNIVKLYAICGQLGILFSSGYFGSIYLDSSRLTEQSIDFGELTLESKNNGECELGALSKRLEDNLCGLRILGRFKLNVHKSFKLDFLVDSDCKDTSVESILRMYLLNDNILQMSSGFSKNMENEVIDVSSALQRCSLTQSGNNLNSSSFSDKPEDIFFKNVIVNVYSFILFKQYLIYVAKNKMIIRNDEAICSEVCVDPGMSLLAIHNNRIISQTRFGTLETATSKVFSKALVMELFQKGQYREAANICDQNHIGYDIFYENGKCKISLIDAMEDSQVLSLVSTLKVDTIVPHENDSLEILTRMFKVEQVFDGSINTDKVLNTDVIRADSVSHLFTTSYQNPLFSIDLQVITEENEAIIDLAKPVESINRILKNLKNDKHINTIVGLFVLIGRIDFCFYLPDIKKVCKILVGSVSTYDIIRAAISTLSIEKITVAYKVCQSDVLPFISFYNSSSNLHFSIYDYLEDRELALYYLIKEIAITENVGERSLVGSGERNASDESFKSIYDMSEKNRDMIIEYVEKHKLLNHLLMYQYYGLFLINFYTYAAKHLPPERAFVLYLLGNDRKEGLALAYKNILWRQALIVFPGEECALKFIDLLEEERRYSEIGEIYEEFIGDYWKAVRYYMKGSSYGGAVSAWNRLLAIKQNGVSVDRRLYDMNAEVLLDDSEISDTFFNYARIATKNEVLALKELESFFDKNVERIEKVRDRLDSNVEMSQSSHSSSTSSKSVRNALIKDRPGGVYENEYVLNKLRDVVLDIVKLYQRTLSLLEIFEMGGLCECMKAYRDTFGNLRLTLRGKVDRLWEYKRHDYDPNRPIIAKPELPLFFE